VAVRTLLLVAAASLAACSGQPLEPWHTVKLVEEFDAGRAEDIRTLDGYLALEERLFEELKKEVYSQVDTGPEFGLFRYSAGSAADPFMRKPDFNRTFELVPDKVKGSVLLLHGMSDSPYSLHAIGQTLFAQGYRVIGLRLPGHGTAPSGLVSVRWQEMAAATRLAADHLVSAGGDLPLHVIGYSTGAGLALDLALNALDDPALRMPDSLVLVSPAIGITRFAALAGMKAALGRLPGFAGLAYTQVIPEFDPYKYNSFTANAGAQVHKLTSSVARRIAQVALTDDATRLPPILVFKSTIDATVSTEAVVDRLMGLLPDSGNEFVLFDINRSAVVSAILVEDPGPFTNRMMGDETLPFGIRLVTNENPQSAKVVARYKPPNSSGVARTEALGLSWPQGVLSLSHVALPFTPDDPLYGRFRPDDPDALFLGQPSIRGERGRLRISSDWLLRLRYNPFYAYLESRTLRWFDDVERKR
jgi:alpha-beta hydrolase superfamily lysophospholipase